MPSPIAPGSKTQHAENIVKECPAFRWNDGFRHTGMNHQKIAILDSNPCPMFIRQQTTPSDIPFETDQPQTGERNTREKTPTSLPHAITTPVFSARLMSDRALMIRGCSGMFGVHPE